MNKDNEKTQPQEDVIRTMAWVTFASQILHATVTYNLENIGNDTKNYEEMIRESAATGADMMLKEFDKRFRQG